MTVQQRLFSFSAAGKIGIIKCRLSTYSTIPLTKWEIYNVSG
nr:MAG TPA: hypothetical protein [Caudoviricetes sp.]